MDGYMVSHSLPMEKNGEVRGHGMNFACGRTGVFDTLVNAPNMATQINLFQQVLEEKLYTKRDLKSSIAPVSLVGNGYAAYLAGNSTIEVSGIRYSNLMN
ncbi:GDSL esterase/lipase [Vitis vinifera]|uniref:GDSL esterase/lipase n=1 Tax=Vitis vinifera TaxID=29760 RepID=A0A438IC03_VITVI|nr:GDSL esterase/lipase [Vitis vinifera]